MIFIADKPEKIKGIALVNECDEMTAGRIYTIGALKAAKRRGTARSYCEAIAQLENEQMGDRRNPITRTMSAEGTAINIADINHMNNAGSVGIYRQGFTVDPDGKAAPARFFIGHMEGKPPAEKTERPHNVNMGKVLGTLYTEWEAREAETVSESIHNMTAETIAKNMTLYFTDYTQRMSKTVQSRIAELQRYTGDIKALVSAKGRESPETSKLANFAVNLHRQFEHKDSLTVSEFTDLLRQYAPAMDR
jgi:predicted SnoaL-like aldol condensation-catalyzing enzyme